MAKIFAETGGESSAGAEIVINNAWAEKAEGETVEYNGQSYVIGTNAFASVDAARQAALQNGGESLIIGSGADVSYGKNESGDWAEYFFLNTEVTETADGWSYDLVVDAANTFDLTVNGTFAPYQILMNNAALTVSEDGKIRSSETLRIMGGTAAISGTRAADAADPAASEVFGGSWGGGTKATDQTQVFVGYFQANQGAEVTIDNSQMMVHAGLFSVDNSAVALDNTYLYLGSGGTYADVIISLTNGATLDLSNNSSMVNDPTFGSNISVDGTSVLNLDADSKIIASTLNVAEGGKVVIDAADFTGFKKVIDISGTESLEGKVTFENLADGVSVIYGEDGDISLSNINVETLYVNAEYAGEYGEDLGDGKFFGINAFSSFVEALKSVTADTTKIELAGDITESATTDNVAVVINDSLTISGGNVNWTDGKGWIQFKKAEGAESATLNFVDFELSGAASNTKVFYFSDGVYATVDKDSSVEIYNGAIQPGATVKIEDGGKFYSIKEALQVQANSEKRGTLIVEGENAVAYTKYVNVYGDADISNAKFSAFDYINVRDAGEFTADNSVVEIGADQNGTWNNNPAPNGFGQLKVSSADAVFNLTNNSTLKASGHITNSGTINIEDSTFIADGTLVSDGTVAAAYNKGVLTNNGTINVSGESTLIIRELAGDNSIKLADGATIKDSTINGGSVTVGGDVTFVGDNTVGTLGLGYYNHKVTIGEGASLNANGTGRTTLSYGNTIDVDGTIEDAKTADKTAVKNSLNIASGFSFTGNGTYDGIDATLDVDNAYVSFGSSTSKNSAATGNFVFDFNNSIVDFNADFKLAASTKDTLDPHFQLNVTDSVFSVTKNFGLNHENAVAVFDNSVVNANANFRNAGTTTVKNGSVMTVASNSDGPSRENTGNFGTLNVEGAGSLFDISNGTTAAANAFYNAGAVNISDSGEFKVGQFENAAGSELSIDGGIFNATVLNNAAATDDAEGGTVNVNGGKLDIETVTNKGTVQISGESTVNIDTYTGSQLLFDNVSLVGDSNIGGNVFALNDFELVGTLTVKQTNFYGNATVKDGATFNGSTTIVGGGSEFTLENGGTVNSRFFNVVGGTAEINGNINLKHSDPRQKLLQLHKDGVANVNTGAVITIDGHNAVVNEGGTLNIKGGTLNITKWAQNENDPARGGNLYNEGAVSIDALGTLNASTISGNGTITIDATGFTGTKKLIDLNQTTSLEGKVTIIGDGISAIYGADGDVTITDIPQDTIYVNSAWSSYNDGETIEDGYIFGFNSFADLAYPATDATKKVQITGGTYSNPEGVYNSSVSLLRSGINEVAADGEVVVDTGSLVFQTDAEGDVNISGDYTTTDKIRYTGTWGVDWTELQNGHIRFVGGDDTVFNIDGNFTSGENIQFIGGKSVISKDSVLTVSRENYGQYAIYADVVNYGKMVIALDEENGAAMHIGYGSNQGSLTLSGADASLYVDMADGALGAADINVNNGSLIVEDGASAVSTGKVTVAAGSEIVVDNAAIEFGSLANEGDVTVSGDSTVKAQMSGSGKLVFDGANLTDSDLNSGIVRFKGENTYAGNFTASTVYVGDWEKEEYTGSVDFGTDSDVTVKSQMIIGYDSTVAGANNVVFGDADGEATDKVFKASDISVRRDGTLTIANTTGDNKISTMNVMGTVVVDNAKLSGEVQIGVTGEHVTTPEMIVRNGAEVNLGGSSNSVVILGKGTNGAKLTIDDATVTVKRAGAGAGYKVPADTFVIGYNGGTGELNVSNNGKFVAADYNGDKDGGKMNVQLNTGSEINLTSGGSADIAGTLDNNGTVNVEGGNLTAGAMNLGAELKIEGLTAGEAREITVALFGEGEESGMTVTVSVAANATSAVLNTQDIADGDYNLTIIDGTTVKTGTATVTNGKVFVDNGTLTAGTLSMGLGAFEVTGESSVKIDKIEDGAVVLKGTLTDSDVKSGSVKAYGDAVLRDSFIDSVTVINGETVIEGDVTVNNIGTNYGASDITISDGGVLNVGQAASSREDWVNGTGATGVVGDIWMRPVKEDGKEESVLTVEDGGRLNVYGQISNRGSIVVEGEMNVEAIEGAGSLALAGVASAAGSMVIDGGSFTDTASLWTSANDLKPINSLTVGENTSGGTSVLEVKNGGSFKTTDSYMTIYENGSLVVDGSTFDMTYPTNNTGSGILWENTKPEATLINDGSVEISKADFSATSIVNDGTMDVSGSKFSAETLTGTGSFTVSASFDEEGNAVATELNIDSLQQNISANQNSDSAIVLTGNIGMPTWDNYFRVYGDATISGMNINADYDGALVSASGMVNAYGDTVITGNTVMNLNAFQTTNSGVIEAGSVINTANFNAYDMGAVKGDAIEAVFTIEGTVNAVSFIVTNDYYSKDGNDELIVAEGGLVSATTMSGHGRFSLQTGAVTVYGSVEGNLSAGGGESNIGEGEGYAMILTVDGTYASADNDNGKFIKVGDQNLSIYETSEVNVVNGGTFSWENTIKNVGDIYVADSSFAAGSVTNGETGTITVAGESTVNAAVTGDVVFADGVVLGADTVLTVNGNITSDGAVTFDWNDVTATKLTAKNLTINNVTLSSDETITVFDGEADVETMVINGSNVSNNQVVLDGIVYDVTIGEDVTMKVSDNTYDPMTGGITGITQGEGGYTFTVTADITGGEGDYIYNFSATDANGKELALTNNGLEFTLTDIPAAGAGAINVTMTVTDAFGASTQYTTETVAADVVDYKAPEFAEGPTATVNKNTVKLSWTATDETEIAGYEIIFDGESYEIGFGASGKASSLTFKNLSAGDHTYVIKAYDAAGNELVSEEQVVTINTNTNLSDNGVSQIVGWDAAAGKVGYIDNVGEVAPEWKSINKWERDDAAKWEVVGVGKFEGSEADRDGILLFDTTSNTYVAWTDITSDDFGSVTLSSVDAGYKTVGLGNFNGNGYDDVLMVNEDGRIGVLLDGTGYKEVYAGGADIEVIGSGDFGAADGLDSLIVKNNAEGTYELWHNNDSTYETGDWTVSKLYDGDDDWTIAAVGDFSGDGIDDIVVWQESTGYMFALEDGNAENYRWVGQLDQSGWEVAAVGDYNGDGAEDLLLRETTSGWGGLGYWGGAYCENWTDLNARIESDKNGNSFQVIA